MSTLPSLPNDIRLALDQLADDRGVSEKHAAAILGISVSKLQKDRVRGSGPRYVKHGKTKFARVTYRLGDLRSYQRENTHQSTSTYLEAEGGLSELGLLKPYALLRGMLRGFIDSIGDDPDEIVWRASNDARSHRPRALTIVPPSSTVSPIA
jgi:hypothetical protein